MFNFITTYYNINEIKSVTTDTAPKRKIICTCLFLVKLKSYKDIYLCINYLYYVYKI